MPRLMRRFDLVLIVAGITALVSAGLVTYEYTGGSVLDRDRELQLVAVFARDLQRGLQLGHAPLPPRPPNRHGNSFAARQSTDSPIIGTQVYDSRVVSRRRRRGFQLKSVIWAGLVLSLIGLGGCNNLKYQVGGIVTGLSGSGLALEDNGGTSLTITGNGAFAFATGVKNGDVYAVTVAAEPSNPAQTCTVYNGSGTIDKAAITHIIVTCTQAGQFAWVANQTSNDISAYAIDQTTGFLTPVANSPFTASGSTPTAIVVDPNGAYAYVTNNASNTVGAYSIESTSGTLTAVGFPVATQNGPIAVIVDPSNSYLYVANQASNSVSAFSISAGALTEIAGSPYAVGAGPISLRTDPGGNYLYVVNFTDGTISVFTIDTSTGTLTGVVGSPFAAGTGASSIAIDPTGTFAYVANASAATISAFSITADSGALSPVTDSPFSTGSAADSIAVDPAGAHLYAANATAADEVATFTIVPSTGALQSPAATANAGALPIFVTIDPAGTFAYVANGNSSDVSVYSLSTGTGLMTEVNGSPFAAGSGPRSIAIH